MILVDHPAGVGCFQIWTATWGWPNSPNKTTIPSGYLSKVLHVWNCFPMEMQMLQGKQGREKLTLSSTSKPRCISKHRKPAFLGIAIWVQPWPRLPDLPEYPRGRQRSCFYDWTWPLGGCWRLVPKQLADVWIGSLTTYVSSCTGTLLNRTSKTVPNRLVLRNGARARESCLIENSPGLCKIVQSC